MPKVKMTDPETGRFALFDEQPGVATPETYADPNSDVNAPLNNPEDYFASIYAHSDFDNLEVAASDEGVTINHVAVTAAPAPGGISSTANFGWGTGTGDHLLLTHNLGYVPMALVSRGFNAVGRGIPVQNDGVGGTRVAWVYCTTTEVRLYEFSSTGPSSLSAISLEYDVLVFKNPPPAVGVILEDFDPDTGVVQWGLGKFKSDRKYLQVVPGGSPFGLSFGRQIDLKNGGVRFVLPDESTVEPVPAISTRLDQALSGFGAVMGYNGSYAGTETIQVQAP